MNKTQSVPQAPIRVVQFGEGKLLRGLIDVVLQQAADSGRFDGAAAIVKPTDRGDLAAFARQDCRFHVVLRGLQHGERFDRSFPVTIVRRAVHPYRAFGDFLALAREPSLEFVISNTTEAGIAIDPSDRFSDEPPRSFPGKLTRLLWERYRFVGGDPSRGLTVFPTELIEHNGEALRRCVLELAGLWGLDKAFLRWVSENCRFCPTLVDRIVSGCAKEELPALWERLGERDELVTVGEPFGMWAIEAPADVAARFPVDGEGSAAFFVSDLAPWKQRKVRILNGGHTALTPAAYLAGQELVRCCMEDALLRGYLERAEREELVPFVPLPRAESEAFARDVLERFSNPFLDHRLLDIAANSMLKWRERVLPSVLDGLRAGQTQRLLAFSFAALLAFSTAEKEENGVLFGRREGGYYPLRDVPEALALIRACSRGDGAAYVRAVLSWLGAGELNGFADIAAGDLCRIRASGVRAALLEALEEGGRDA